MRDREEIEYGVREAMYTHMYTEITIEVLLDIRELLIGLDARPPVKHPESPKPPKVT